MKKRGADKPLRRFFFVTADEIVLRLSARSFFDSGWQKTQVILDVLPSIFGAAVGKVAAENRD